MLKTVKKIISLILFSVLVLSFGGCAEEEQTLTTEKADEDYVFTDDLGRTVTVKSTDRVACLLGSFADMWMLAGGEVAASADDAWEDFSLPLKEDTVNLGSAHKFSKESLLGCSPDFVIGSSKLSKHLDIKDTLDSAGIASAFFDVDSFDSYLKVLKIMTDLTGNEDAYIKYGTEQEEKIDALLSSHADKAPQTVLVMRASAGSIRAKNSTGTMLSGMLHDFGCINIADSDTMLLENLNIESIMKENPDKIFFVETGDDIEGIKTNVNKMFAENPLWNELHAVKNGKVYYMDKHLYNLKPNARFFEAYEKLEKILYEE